jgi:ABC-2 type transport system ATP-binding protein
VEHAIDQPGSPAEPPATGPTATPAVECRDLVVRYGDTVAVDHLSFTAQAGEIVALLGPNGAGKTSTVETLEGYRRPTAGSVRVLGLDPQRDHAALVRRMGVMLQKGGIYPMLGSAQVLDLFARYYDDPEDPEQLIDLVGLGDVRKTPWRRLSGGEQQRLSLALALVGKPSVVFLDEPTAGVDPEGRLAVRAVIAGLSDRGISVILTTHELTEAERLADRVIIIDHGRKLAEDTPAQLAAGSADGSIRFTADAGLDTGALAAAVGEGATVDEERPGHYRLRLGPAGTAPEAVATVARWLAEQHLTLGDLRTGSSLEEAYLAITGSSGTAEPEPASETADRGRRGRRGRRTRT